MCSADSMVKSMPLGDLHLNAAKGKVIHPTTECKELCKELNKLADFSLFSSSSSPPWKAAFWSGLGGGWILLPFPAAESGRGSQHASISPSIFLPRSFLEWTARWSLFEEKKKNQIVPITKLASHRGSEQCANYSAVSLQLASQLWKGMGKLPPWCVHRHT